MGYTSLKAALDAYVKTNGSQSITGAGLNNVMTQILQGVDIADRANGTDTTGMTYKILDKGSTFASQVTGTNTIYEIRDEFDLGGNSVTIPTGSVLHFNGGRINNGSVDLNSCAFNEFKGNATISNLMPGVRYTDKELGMIPNDRNAASLNVSRLVSVITSNSSLKIDDVYYLTGASLVMSNLDICGDGTIILLGSLTANQASGFKYIHLDGITIVSEDAYSGKNLDNTANSLGETTQHHFLNLLQLTGGTFNEFRIENCTFNNIFLLTAGNNSVEKLVVENCRILNVVYRFIHMSGTFHTANILRNYIERYNNIVFNINADYAYVRDNFITNKEYVTRGYQSEIYLTPFVLTTKVTEATGNVWQDIVVNTTDYGCNFYTLYSKSQFFVFKDNVIKNYANINSDVCYLVYSKTGVALRDVQIVGNSWENDDTLAETYDLSASVVGITFFDTSIQHDNINISGNTIKTPTLFCFGSATIYRVNTFQILNNTITAKDYASVQPDIIAANSPTSQGLIQGNKVTLTAMVGTDIGSILNGAFGSVAIRDNDLKCTPIRNASGSGVTFDFSNLIIENTAMCGSGSARPMYVVGKMSGCTFQYVGGGRNINLYFQKITGQTDVRDCKVLISTGNDTLTLRRILSSTYNSDYSIVAFSLVNRIVKICIDNVNSCIYIDGVKYTYTSTSQTASVTDGNTTANISYGNDRISHVGAYDRVFEFRNVDSKDFNQVVMDSIPKVMPLAKIQAIDTGVLSAGFSLYDSTNNRQVFWNGTAWIDSAGTPI